MHTHAYKISTYTFTKLEEIMFIKRSTYIYSLENYEVISSR